MRPKINPRRHSLIRIFAACVSLLFKEQQARTLATLAGFALIQTKASIFYIFIPCGNIDGTDQPVHPPSLINIVRYKDSFVLIQAKYRVFYNDIII